MYFLFSLDSPTNKDEDLQPQKENVEIMDEGDGSEFTHLSGLFEPLRLNHKQVRYQHTDSLSVIVPIQSLEDKSDSWQMSENYQDGETKFIGSEDEPCNTSHVTSSGSRLRRVDKSVSEEFASDLPPWKRQILLNRKLKEKAREKAEREKVADQDFSQKFHQKNILVLVFWAHSHQPRLQGLSSSLSRSLGTLGTRCHSHVNLRTLRGAKCGYCMFFFL